MWKIQYQWSNRLPLCYFDNYEVAVEALETLKENYPNAIIELVKIQPISCHAEFLAETNMGQIREYN